MIGNFCKDLIKVFYNFENYYIRIEVFGFNINILRYILYYFANDCRILLTLLLYNLGRGIRTWGK
ncbi:hypothetical protein CWE04_13790 [Thomasclavelia cocleata]|uniref:Uncharacterized protein n=1 Tax=Thomasclavelia cocleata TaxID=69824 RepID=A0A1I0DNG2_9FIRM|nr:hypothetical protein CWE04_13790 [Thomasclavelia cocleata]SET34076.1 hypothetical protein SAMN04489758_1072 [Thomasclavelia cocleata]